MNRTSTRPGRGDEERHPFTKSIARVVPGRDVFRRKLMGRSTRFRGAPFLLLKAQKPKDSAGDLTCGGDIGGTALRKAFFTADLLCLRPRNHRIEHHFAWISVAPYGR